MLSSPIVKYLKLILLLTAASIILVGSECLHRWYFNISPLGRPWEEFLYLLTFTSCLCFSRWKLTKICVAFFRLFWTFGEIGLPRARASPETKSALDPVSL